MKIDLIGFDADDTLWHNESLYAAATAEFEQLLAPWCSPDAARARLHEIETRNLDLFGYGIKGFVISMIETSTELLAANGAAAQARLIPRLIEIGKEMLRDQTRVFDGVEAALASLAQEFPLMIITKGDLLDQENKVQRSGLGNYFSHVEVISHKTPARYQAILDKHRVKPQHFLMVGNSLKSDILPVLAIGGHAIYIPSELIWAHEAGERPAEQAAGYYELGSLPELPALIANLRNSGAQETQ